MVKRSARRNGRQEMHQSSNLPGFSVVIVLQIVTRELDCTTNPRNAQCDFLMQRQRLSRRADAKAKATVNSAQCECTHRALLIYNNPWRARRRSVRRYLTAALLFDLC